MEINKFIKIGNELVPVSDDVYAEYMRPIWREEKREERERDYEKKYGKKRVVSYNVLENYENANKNVFGKLSANIEEMIIEKDKLLILEEVLDTLTLEDRALINAVVIGDMTESEYSRQTGIPRKTISYRKNKIIDNLKKQIADKADK